MTLHDDITIELKGIQTVGTVNAALRKVLPGKWFVDWRKWRDEMGERTVVLSQEPLKRQLTLPVVLETSNE